MNIFSQLFGTSRPSSSDVDAAQAQARLHQQDSPFLLDVREPEEYREGHIAGAVLVPLGQLAARLGELPRDREILCVCHSGNRSGYAARLLAGQGFRTANLTGGMIAWQRAGFQIIQDGRQ